MYLILFIQYCEIQTTVDHRLYAEDQTTDPSYEGGDKRAFSCYYYHMRPGKLLEHMTRASPTPYLIVSFDSRFALLNVQLFEGSFPT
jgi:hypothetical protein